MILIFLISNVLQIYFGINWYYNPTIIFFILYVCIQKL